ncbi:MAG: hypothetical protein HYU75_08270 [Betaproteobacteria bacterium]|nr:hypothetical protein [Betaproteobacteria bacterium]
MSAAGVNRTYDATTGATVNLADNRFAGDALALAYGSAAFADKNAGTGKPVSVSGITVTGTDAGNYSFNTAATATANITPAALTVTASGVNRNYDGTTIASANLSDNRFAGDALTPTYASAAFADKNAGTGKAVTVSGIALSGADAGNYAPASTSASTTGNITVRPLSTWTGSANSLWSNPANWDALPDGSNVLAVSIPSGSGQVIYDATAGSTNLQNLNSAQTLALAGGTLAIGGALSTTGYAQSGGALAGNGSLNVSGSFSQTGGTIAVGGTAAITQATGNLQVGSLSAPAVMLTAQNGAITQSAPLVASSLITQSLAGTSLADAGNRIGSFSATNSGSGNVVLTNSGTLTIAGIGNANGNITVDNTGAVTTTGAISAPNGSVSIQAGSPLAIGTGGVSAGGSISLVAGATSASNDLLTISGPISTTASTGSVTLFAADGISQSANVSTGGCGVTATAQAGDIVMALGATTSTNGGAIAYAAPSGNIVLTSLNAGSGAVSVDAGGNITVAAGFDGANLIGESALIAARGNAYLSTQVSSLVEKIEGDYAIRDVITGKVNTGEEVLEIQPKATVLVASQVVTTIVAASEQKPAKAAAETAPPPAPVPSSISPTGLLTLTDTGMTIGGTEGTFGGSLTPAAAAPAPSAEGEKPAVEKTAAIKPIEDKPAEAKKEEAKKDEAKKDDDKKKKEQETTAKKEDKKAAAKKAPVCN